MLFDPGSTFSYVSTYFAAKFEMICDSMTVPIRASMPTFEGGQTSRGSYSPSLGSYSSQQRAIGRGNYSGFSGSTQQFPGQRFCFTCGDPDHLMCQCTSQRGRGGPRHNSSF